MLYTLLLSLTVALWGCGGDGKDEPQPGNVNITVSQDNITVPATGGTYTINVTTTGKEWGAYADKDFITIDAKNTTSQSGTMAVTWPSKRPARASASLRKLPSSRPTMLLMATALFGTMSSTRALS